VQIDLIGNTVEGGAVAHDLVPGGEIWASWHLDLQVLIPLALVTAFYLRGLARWRMRSREHPRWRTACFLLGMAALVLAIESPLDTLADHHFSMHMTQHLVITSFAVPLILLGAPTTPLLKGLPSDIRQHIVRPLARSRGVHAAFGVLTHPLTAAVAWSVVMYAWHLAPGWYDAALDHPLLHDVQHASFVLIALMVWWNVIDPAPLHGRLGYIARMGLLLVVSTSTSFLGAMIAFNEEPLYDFYLRAEPILALTPVDDQEIGGLIMWVPGQMMHLLAAGIVFGVWAHKAEQQQRAAEEAAALAADGTAARATSLS
jgi:cytochrome c oxidase assembly factor CtaG